MIQNKPPSFFEPPVVSQQACRIPNWQSGLVIWSRCAIKVNADATDLVAESAVLSVAHSNLVQGIGLVANANDNDSTCVELVLERVRPHVPNDIVPLGIRRKGMLPSNANGKFNRDQLASEFSDLLQKE